MLFFGWMQNVDASKSWMGRVWSILWVNANVEQCTHPVSSSCLCWPLPLHLQSPQKLQALQLRHWELRLPRRQRYRCPHRHHVKQLASPPLGGITLSLRDILQLDPKEKIAVNSILSRMVKYSPKETIKPRSKPTQSVRMLILNLGSSPQGSALS